MSDLQFFFRIVLAGIILFITLFLSVFGVVELFFYLEIVDRPEELTTFQLTALFSVAIMSFLASWSLGS